MLKIILRIIVVLSFLGVNAQNGGVIKGKVIDSKTREALPFVNILVVGTNLGTVTGENGEFEISKVSFGYNTIQASFLGYLTAFSDDYLVTNDKSPYIFIELIQSNELLNEVIIEPSPFKKSIESPLSTQTLGIAEIERNPGGNRDALKVIQSFPGVASNPGFRNDIIIRGGSPIENKFYLDGIEVPVINHFQTQGATGGPVGIINADLVRNVDFYTSSFQANRGNALSSVIEFTQKEGNTEQLNTRATFGTSDAGITLDGPINQKSSFIFSLRQSYLQYLFKLIKLPFLPTYNDVQFKIKHQISSKSELSIIGLGALDKFKLNEKVNNNISDIATIKRNNYILSNIPIQEQWNYTIGASYKHFSENAVQQLVFSRNEWNNTAKKYVNNTTNQTDLLLDYTSKETENKLRLENTITTANNYKINLGIGLENALYTNTTFQKIANSNGVSEINFISDVSFTKYSFFGQVSQKFLKSKLRTSLGMRFDGIDYNTEMKNVFNQFSPRIAVSYEIVPKIMLNTTFGNYFQLPAYTILGYRDNFNHLSNKNSLKYINAKHYVTGIEVKPSNDFKVSLEGFYKKYDNYPFSVRDQISLANLGSDFGVIGNENVTSTSKGRAYGLEVFAQKKSYKGLYGLVSYTFVVSEFKDASGNFIPSSWDNKHLLTITGGKKLKKNWEVGGKLRFVGGSPYTPYDLNASSIIENYNVSNSGILNYTQLNAERYANYHQLDVRVDKTWYWKRLSLNFYIDVQNIYGSESIQQPYLIPSVDENGNRVIDANDSSRYVLEEIENNSGTVLPRFGVIIDF